MHACKGNSLYTGRADSLDKTVYLSLLLDFYGLLLTEKQREYADLYYNENLSLSEIAENDGISRQAVRDTLLRAETVLRDTEAKTGLVARHTKLLTQIGEAEALLERVGKLNSQKLSSPDLLSLCLEMQRKLDEMKL